MMLTMWGGFGGMLYGLDSWYFILVLPTILLAMFAQSRVKSTFAKYSGVRAQSGYTGLTAARRILDQNGLRQVNIEGIRGQLTDHFDPRANVLRLSESTYGDNSIAAIGVAAHEAGHAVQHAVGYIPNKIRGALVPVAQIGSSVGPYMAIFGIFLGLPFLTEIGIVLFAGAFLFYLITLPVEFNASSRAMRLLEDQGILGSEELRGARKVLNAAAMTYVASALTAFASLLRLVLLSRGRNGRR
ncbi:MAG: zinc metallopeptidase [Eubacteriales bacterium]|nr:zinc metallopeptidase [Eubacteriales bacterium]